MWVAASEWNSLEVAKLGLAVLTPSVLFWLGRRVADSARRVEDAQWANRTFVERRLELYKEMAPLINDLYCIFLKVGRFRDIDPPDAITAKRQADGLFYTNEYLFSEPFRKAYQTFMDVAFKLYVGFGQDAQLRMLREDLKRERGTTTWEADWDKLFTSADDASPRADIRQRYRELMQAFASEIGVEDKPRPKTRRFGLIHRGVGSA